MVAGTIEIRAAPRTGAAFSILGCPRHRIRSTPCNAAVSARDGRGREGPPRGSVPSPRIDPAFPPTLAKARASPVDPALSPLRGRPDRRGRRNLGRAAPGRRHLDWPGSGAGLRPSPSARLWRRRLSEPTRRPGPVTPLGGPSAPPPPVSRASGHDRGMAGAVVRASGAGRVPCRAPPSGRAGSP